MATPLWQDGSPSRPRTALHGMLVALPLSTAMWCAIVVLVAALR